MIPARRQPDTARAARLRRPSGRRFLFVLAVIPNMEFSGVPLSFIAGWVKAEGRTHRIVLKLK